MRQIKFRGKCPRGNWHYGSLVIYNERDYYIFNKGIDKVKYETDVDLESVGQFTGLYDEDGKEIYEGDILKPFAEGLTYWIKFEKGKFVIYVDDKFWADIDRGFFIYKEYLEEIKVIGNIHENKDI